ncbi:hypothetical protein DU002_04315 [Corallincola holothuriorum]|uniref:Uncharacterized protein n=1 Tax=Corallincola holothuriorum TaxID=2282215 RepID=A0A368NR00_9GAMM|nr:hypothetical protein [Corallincola holothuriorum]RCU51701.1 hypothetical protein DU002_04315 [Corallincola holothuriorum]
MEELVVAIGAFMLELCIFSIMAVSRPFQFLISGHYRQQMKNKWAGRSRIRLYLHLFNGVLLLAALLIAAGWWLYTAAPQPSTTDKLQQIVTETLIETI